MHLQRQDLCIHCRQEDIMSDFIIMTDSTTDLPESFFDEKNIFQEPHAFIIDEVSYKDLYWKTMGKEQYYKLLKDGKHITTSQADMEKIYADCEKAFSEGRDVLYICFSKELSGTYATTRMIAKEMEEKYPGRRFETVDTFSATRGQGMLVEMTAKMREEGASMDDVINTLEIEKDKIYHFFTVDDLMHLKRGGRLSATSAVMGTLIGIKPVLHMSDDGKLIPIGKVRGMHKALDEIVRMSLEKIDDSTDKVYVANVGCRENAEYAVKALEEKGVRNVVMFDLGPVISSHVGCGTVGIIFHSEK